MLAMKHHFSLCLAYGYIYSIGGEDRNSKLKDCQRYNIKGNKWEPISALLSAREGAACCKYNVNYLYAIGGCNVKGVERLDINKLEWTEIAVQQGDDIMVQGACAIEYSGRLLILGGMFGYKKSDYCLKMSIYDNDEHCICKIENAPVNWYFVCTSSPIHKGDAIFVVDTNRCVYSYNGRWKEVKYTI